MSKGGGSSILPEGKLPIEVLTPILESIPRGSLVIPPGIGVDVGVSKSHGKYIVTSSDPITGTEKRMGWHAVNVSANDVATSGIMPDTLNVVGLFPKTTTVKAIKNLMTEINKTANHLGIAVAGGHTEITPHLTRPIVVVTAIGSGQKFVTAANAKLHDAVLMTKNAAIEGTSIISGLAKVKERVGVRVSMRGERMIKKLSILKEAKLAFRTGLVHAMHDVTEGGVVGAILEMGLASKLGVEMQEDSVPMDDSTRALGKILSLDPLRLLGSGSLLIACSMNDRKVIIRELESEGIPCTCIGRFVSNKKGNTVVSKDGIPTRLNQTSIQDELWPVLRRCS